MEAPVDLRGLARNGLLEMAACGLKARGLRKDGVLLSGWARGSFAGSRCMMSRDLHVKAARAGYQ